MWVQNCTKLSTFYSKGPALFAGPFSFGASTVAARLALCCLVSLCARRAATMVHMAASERVAARRGYDIAKQNNG